MSLYNLEPKLRTHDFAQISVALNGRFYFRTDLMRGVEFPDNICQKLAEKFPASEGYSIKLAIHPNRFTMTDVEN